MDGHKLVQNDDEDPSIEDRKEDVKTAEEHTQDKPAIVKMLEKLDSMWDGHLDGANVVRHGIMLGSSN